LDYEVARFIGVGMDGCTDDLQEDALDGLSCFLFHDRTGDEPDFLAEEAGLGP
jgi:hypothetical protein